jgi:hypothetical protein
MPKAKLKHINFDLDIEVVEFKAEIGVPDCFGDWNPSICDAEAVCGVECLKKCKESKNGESSEQSVSRS